VVRRGRVGPFRPRPLRPAARARYVPPVRLHVLTYNIRSGTDMLGRPRLAEQAAVLRDTAADLVLLQEVAHAGQAEWLAGRAALPHLAFGATRRTSAGEFGNAMLCRWPLRQVTNRLVSRGRLQGQPRAVLSAMLACDGHPVHVLGTHFGLLPGEAERAAHLVVALAGARGGPLIAGGDLNRPWAAAACHRRLRAVLLDCARVGQQRPQPTFPAPRPVLRLDYLYARDLVVREARVLPSRASDHCPLLVGLDLPGA
jgi:endonuclease/exonuclease/phosphatase family metal-dependent hydrolase